MYAIRSYYGEDWQAEIGYAKVAAVMLATLAAAEHDLIAAELCVLRHFPVAGGAGLVVPVERLGIFRTAFAVANGQLRRQQRGIGQRETLAAAAARQMLHRQRLASYNFV